MHEFLIKNGVIVNDPGISANNLLVLDTDKKLIDTHIPFQSVAVLADLATISGSLKDSMNNLSYVVRLTGDQTISGIKTFTDNVQIEGDLIVLGTEYIVHTSSISAVGTQLILNSGEVGAGVTAGIAGIRIDRGSLPYYDLEFRESDDTFVLGISGNYQAIATREDVPLNGAFSWWDTSSNKFITSTAYTTGSWVSKQLVAEISAGLRSQIIGANISAGSGLSVIESPDNTWTIAITGSFGDANLRSEVGIVTGALNSRVYSLETIVNTISSSYITYNTVLDISGYLQSEIINISGVNLNQATQIASISSTNITQTQNLNSLNTSVSYLASVSGSFSTTPQIAALSGQLTPITTVAALTGQLQAASPALSALSNYNTNGFIVQTSQNTFAGRSLGSGTGISISNANGVGGNPSISVNDYISNTTVSDISSALYSIIQSTSGQGSTVSASANILAGIVSCVTGQKYYTVNHNTIELARSVPILTVGMPTSGDALVIVGVFNRTQNAFSFELSLEPPTPNYYVYWSIISSTIAVSGYSAGLPDAPNDGQFYARRNQTWTQFVTGGSGTGTGDITKIEVSAISAGLLSTTFAASSNAQLQVTNNLSPLIFAISGNNISQASQITSISGQLSAIVSITGQFQTASTTLSAFSNYNSNGIIVQTSQNTFTGRSLSAGYGISILNANGSAGNPLISVNDYISNSTVASISSNLYSIIQSTSGQGSTVSASANILSGIIMCVTGQKYYTVNHNTINLSRSVPILTVGTPSSGSTLGIVGVYNRTQNSFDFELSLDPPSLNYSVYWSLISPTIAVSGYSAGLPDAPNDGQFYARRNLSWTPFITGGGTGDITKTDVSAISAGLLSQTYAASANALTQATNNLSPLIFAISGNNISQSSQIANISGQLKSLVSITGSFATTSSLNAYAPLTTVAALTGQLQVASQTLSAFSNYNSNGFIVQTAPNTFIGRSLGSGTGISISNQNGSGGNPSISVNDYISNTTVSGISGALYSIIQASSGAGGISGPYVTSVNGITGAVVFIGGQNISISGTTISLSGNIEKISKTIYQVGHGLIVGKVVRFNGSNWIYALADSPANAESIGIIVSVSPNTFDIVSQGFITLDSGSFIPGSVYFLSDSASGDLSLTEPTINGAVSKPVFYAISTTSGYVYNMRGDIISNTILIDTTSNQSISGHKTFVDTISIDGQFTLNSKIITSVTYNVSATDVVLLADTQANNVEIVLPLNPIDSRHLEIAKIHANNKLFINGNTKTFGATTPTLSSSLEDWSIILNYNSSRNCWYRF